MSVAYELDFAPAAPPRPRRLTAVPDCAPRVLAPARAFAPPAPAVLRPLEDPAPLRLTRRGVAVLTLAVLVVGAAVVAVAALCAPASPAPQSAGPSVVTVHAGDTLWSIASSAAPNADPRAEVSTLEALNHLHGAALVPGQRLRVR